MKFIIDAHLPPALCTFFDELGYESIHTSELPIGNQTPDQAIIQLAMQENAVVVTKDTDFFHTYLLHKSPAKLVMVKTGNMKLATIKSLFQEQAKAITQLLSQYSLIELYPDKMVVVE